VADNGKHANDVVGQNRLREESKLDSNVEMVQTKSRVSNWMDPAHRLANVRHEFGEHGGVNMSIDVSSTFTVMEPKTMGKLLACQLGLEMLNETCYCCDESFTWCKTHSFLN
jgi:hypothetical protein